MRIGIDGRRLIERRAGVVNYIYENIKAINEIDKENEYYIYTNKEISLDFELNANWKICKYEAKHSLLWLYFSLPKILKKDKIDVFWGPAAFLTKKMKSTRLIVTIHDLIIEKFPKIVSSLKAKIEYKIFTRKACKIADEIICISESTKNDLIEILKIDKNKIKVIYNGTDFMDDTIINDELKVLEKFKITKLNYLLYVSTLHPRKNVDTIIKSFNLLKQHKEYNNLKLVLAGNKGWQCDDVFNLIENSDYKDDIIITGYITDEEKKVLYKNSNVFLYPSLYEGFGLPILEAMSEGNIVITTNCSSLPEVGGDAALYLNSPKDEKELSKLIIYALNLTEDERNKIINKGYEQVKKFDWKNSAKELLEEFEKLGE